MASVGIYVIGALVIITAIFLVSGLVFQSQMLFNTACKQSPSSGQIECIIKPFNKEKLIMAQFSLVLEWVLLLLGISLAIVSMCT
tara:strand:+ start:994 stop:1248 length:255 start_codon:yes stop_codon:yes gene_type:complete